MRPQTALLMLLCGSLVAGCPVPPQTAGEVADAGQAGGEGEGETEGQGELPICVTDADCAADEPCLEDGDGCSNFRCWPLQVEGGPCNTVDGVVLFPGNPPKVPCRDGLSCGADFTCVTFDPEACTTEEDCGDGETCGSKRCRQVCVPPAERYEACRSTEGSSCDNDCEVGFDIPCRHGPCTNFGGDESWVQFFCATECDFDQCGGLPCSTAECSEGELCDNGICAPAVFRAGEHCAFDTYNESIRPSAPCEDGYSCLPVGFLGVFTCQ